MNTIIKYFSLTIFICISLVANGQVGESINIPLSNPGQNGSLHIKSQSGRINVSTHDQNDIEVLIDEGNSRNKTNRLTQSGLKRIAKRNLDVTITEEDNEVYIESQQSNQTNITVKVPKNFSLKLGTHHNGDISVEGVNGEIEVEAHHGGIRLTDVSGSVVANTHHGAIICNLISITADTPMSFTTYHGNVDISFPANLTGKLKMKSSKGDIYTDFDFTPIKPKINYSTNGNKKEIKLEGWTYAQIGSGNEEFTFKTYHGDVIIRQN